MGGADVASVLARVLAVACAVRQHGCVDVGHHAVDEDSPHPVVRRLPEVLDHVRNRGVLKKQLLRTVQKRSVLRNTTITTRPVPRYAVLRPERFFFLKMLR